MCVCPVCPATQRTTQLLCVCPLCPTNPTPNPTPTNPQVYPGPEGKARFQQQIRDLVQLGDDEEFEVEFECKAPDSGERLCVYVCGGGCWEGRGEGCVWGCWEGA